MGCAVFLLWGCSRSVTGPDSGASTARGFARLVTPEQLSAARAASPDSLDAAVAYQSQVQAGLMRLTPEVLGTAASTFEGRPVVLALTRRPVNTLARRFAGREVMQMVVGDMQAQAYYCGTSTSRTDMCAAGTLGAIVTDGVRNYWLSNWHVFVRDFGKAGDPIDSPGLFDGGCAPTNLVGSVTRFTPVRFDGTYNTVDCAIASITAGTSVSAIESAGANSFKPSATTMLATVGMAVKKVGRTTKFNTGKVAAINANLAVKYAGIGSANFKGLVICSKMSEEGDSGSLICTTAGNNPVALLFAGNANATIGCPINAVFQAVGAHVAN